MPERKLERRPILDPAVADLLSGLEQKQAETKLPRREREKKVRERAKIQARREQRVTYDLPPLIRQNVKDLAEKEGVPASQLVTLALLRFLRDLDQQQIDLGQYKQPSRSPRYDWNLVLPDSLFPASNRRSRKE
ncbi:MAG: hypothetical protein GYA59_15345 [Chloroflexi bacterium]|jgi:hypothetical protein|nr:hypothetical protein [Chloroflexota bacterium]